ncbi:MULTISPECIES: hypothetical protein [Mesorhizobium]|uniref:hypothetical protein n=1 Tax=unclassified Mesorhizobium TaxID=325217 RepID=UPI0012F9384E|nr:MULTISPECIES: hypothetical protein [Mesorhizobium]MDF3156148.1 hypothetical protein [Mesorhizobium sp. XAP10]MDF3248837.1 hypothetical protein [Mesorhizobium sp. XAP4]
MMEAGELLGMSERKFRRDRDRYEEAGEAGLLDRRLGKLSTRWVPRRPSRRCWNFIAPLPWLEREAIHEHLLRDHGFSWGYTFIKTQLHAAGLVERAKLRGAHRRKEAERGDDAASGWQPSSMAGGWADAGSDRDDGRCDEHDLFGLPDRGGRHVVELSGTSGDIRRQGTAGPAVLSTRFA